MNPTITDDEAELLAMGWELRLAEPERGTQLWMVTEPCRLPEAHRLHQKGWLQRRIDENIEWRLSDEGLRVLRTDTIRSAHSPN